jgi:Mycoplasma protein of unknown function, DUF285
MKCMFCYVASLNQEIEDWDVSNVWDMSYMFYSMTSFYQELSSWNTSTMEGMFVNSPSFHQDVFSWGWNRRSSREALWLPNGSS